MLFISPARKVLKGSVSLTVDDLPTSTYETRFCVKSRLSVTLSLPRLPAAPGTCATCFKRACTMGSRPARPPHSLPLSESPASFLHELTCPRLTVTAGASAAGGAEAEALGAAAVIESAAGAEPSAGTPEGASGAREAAATEPAASAGALGPMRTPAMCGQATPTAKPMIASTPTRVQDGRSPSLGGMVTVSGAGPLAIEMRSTTRPNAGKNSMDPIVWNAPFSKAIPDARIRVSW